MLDNGKISSRQFSVLVALYIIGSAILNIPALLAISAKHDAWIAAIVAMTVGLLVLPLYIHLGNRFSHVTFTWYTEKVMGKWLGRMIALLFFVSFPFLIAILSLRNLGDFMTTQILQDTPIQAIHIIFMIVIIMGVRLGLEPFARAVEIFFPLVIVILLILVVLISPQVKFENVQPLLEEGFKPVLKSALTFIAYPLLEPIILIILFPFIKRTERNGMALFIGTFIGGIVLVVITTLTILVLGSNTANIAFPSYTLAKRISIGHFLERIEVIMAVICSFCKNNPFISYYRFGHCSDIKLKGIPVLNISNVYYTGHHIPDRFS